MDLDIPNGVYNIGSGKAYSVYDICLEVEHQLYKIDEISLILKNGKKSKALTFMEIQKNK